MFVCWYMVRVSEKGEALTKQTRGRFSAAVSSSSLGGCLGGRLRRVTVEGIKVQLSFSHTPSKKSCLSQKIASALLKC